MATRPFRLEVLAAALCLIGIGLTALAPAQEEKRWDILTHNEIGVDRFKTAHPDFDGKGVVIAVLDTGVDMGVEGLRRLPDGKVKVVDVRDFSTEGDLFWKEARIVPDGDGEKVIDAEGRALTHFRSVAADAHPDRFYLAFIEESKFVDSDVKDLNGDGDSDDVFGILVFTVREPAPAKSEAPAKEGENQDDAGAGKGKAPAAPAKPGGLRYVAVVDVNGDGKLDDGVRVTDYWRNHETFVLTGKKGARRELTFAANFDPDHGRLSLHFDSGGHGTHVAGIAAGYRINGQDGYDGMAPGARVISLKIGNNRFSGGATVTESIRKALDYGVEYSRKHKVPVVYNMSFGIGSEVETKSAIDVYVDALLARNPGVVFVTSAGNEGPGLSSVGTPGAATRAITVGALLGPEAAHAQYGFPLKEEVAFSFSSRGGDTYKPDILAPGSASSTVPLWGDQDHFNGTSMASPAAAGAIARLVDALARDEKKFAIDNALILRAVKNTGRHVEGLTGLDEGGGALDLPAAYEYARFLYGSGEDKVLREYRIRNRGPAEGFGCAYWHFAPALPRPSDVLYFLVAAGFAPKIGAEDKARFYRAFDLEPDADWISLTKPMIYLKGDGAASLGIMVDVAGKAPGLYTGKVRAYRKSDERVNGQRIHAFDIPVTVLVPHRTTPENRGTFRVAGEVAPGRFDRVFFEVPPGAKAITMGLRMLEGGKASYLAAPVFDPDGVGRGNVGVVSELTGSLEARTTLSGPEVVPGTWEVVVISTIRSRTPARYDLQVALSGVEFGAPTRFAASGGPTRGQLLVPIRATQATHFRGKVTARFDRFVKRRVIEVEDSDTFTHTLRLDSATKTARWTVEFDRETWGLFTDCVLQVIDVGTGKTLRNEGLGQRTGTTSIPVAVKDGGAKEFKVVLKPAFTRQADSKHWRFVFAEELTWNAPAAELEVVSPKNATVNLAPNDGTQLILRLPAMVPAPPDGYTLGGELAAEAQRPEGVRITEPLRM